jgi:hypothetical protein
MRDRDVPERVPVHESRADGASTCEGSATKHALATQERKAQIAYTFRVAHRNPFRGRIWL